MRNSTYTASIILGSAVFLGFVACGGSSDAGDGAGGISATGGSANNGGIGNTGGAKSGAGASATGGAKAVGGSSAATGGAKNTGGAMTNGGANATGGATTNGGNTESGGATVDGGASSTGGTSGTSVIEQSCTNVAALLASRTTPLDCAAQYDVATCVTTYTKLANATADAACGNGYLALLQCGETQPADSWTCYVLNATIGGTTININIPVPPSTTNTDPCYAQFGALFTLIATKAECQNALN